MAYRDMCTMQELGDCISMGMQETTIGECALMTGDQKGGAGELL